MKKCLALLLVLTIMLPSAVCFAADAPYSVGDTAEDFTVALSDGSEVTLSGLLEEYDAVFLNFFFIGCTWCELEFPYLEKAYEDYADDIAVLAVSPLDEVDEVAAYKEQNGFTFLVGAVEYGTLEAAFGVDGYPTSFMIDREGVICLEESTTPSAYMFRCLFESFVGEDYTSPCTEVLYPEVIAAEYGCPATLEGDDVEVCVSFDDEISFKKLVFEDASPELEASLSDTYYLVPDCSGKVSVSVGPEVDLTSVAVTGSLLVDMEQDETGFFLPFTISDENPIVILLCEGPDDAVYCFRYLIHENYSDLVSEELKETFGPGSHAEDTEW